MRLRFRFNQILINLQISDHLPLSPSYPSRDSHISSREVTDRRTRKVLKNRAEESILDRRFQFRRYRSIVLNRLVYQTRPGIWHELSSNYRSIPDKPQFALVILFNKNSSLQLSFQNLEISLIIYSMIDLLELSYHVRYREFARV